MLEAGEELGGKLRLATVAGHRVDVGAEAMLAVRPEGTAFVERLGAGADLVTPATTAARVYSRGALHPLPTATLMGVPTDPSGALGVLTADEVARAADERPWPGGGVEGDVTVGEYVGARLGRAVVDRLVEPLLGGVYAGHADRLSLRATMPVLWDRARAGTSLLEPVPPRVDADGSRRPPFAGLRGGLGRIPELAAEALRSRGALVRTRAVVRGLERSGEGWRLVVGSAADPVAVGADAVVLALPPAPASRLLRATAPAAASALGEVATASMAVVTLAVRRSGTPALPGSGFLVPPVEGRAVKGSTFSAAKWAWVDELSPDVLYLRASIGRAGDEAVLQRDDADLVTLAVAEVGDLLGTPLGPVVDHHVQRWGGALPQYAVGHVDRVTAVRADVARLPGLEVAGAAYDGVGVPAVLASAHRAAAGVTDHLTRTTPVPGESR
ncbi:protoporphyrinogen oxidase [Phycicoccus sp. CMS6Z-2]|uniref:Coproporphyrinogen III oxidase n=1 Tax=Phycicoccus flavus TaxID=2502783 RepID=A0A8T6R8J3_9MICO|nr:protoporphyrinogen oxidase [Phycicoccus flavus]